MSAEAFPPLRLQLSRARGFNLQEISRAMNGREAVAICRPGKWGNPFVVEDPVVARKAVHAFLGWLRGYRRRGAHRIGLDERREFILANLAELRGKNLACTCAAGEPCHGDPLIRLANPEIRA